ncbi:asparaginase [Paenibacillus tarimensis]|uniref:asparaginase n=2 Tax=Paenibacillus tarimensis TaxID=416012 RepID=UPI0039EEBC1B
MTIPYTEETDMKDRIMVIFTGGTIGSRVNGNVIDVHQDTPYELLKQYSQLEGSRPFEMDTLQPLQVLSENMTPDNWLELLTALEQMDRAPYAGIIITHGSDTVPYTAAMLSYTASHYGLPIVLVASNQPLGHPRSNGLRNFAAAVDFIADADIPGVFVSFENELGDHAIYLGTRMTEALPFNDQFDSPYGVPFGKMVDGIFVPDEHEIQPEVAGLRAARAPAADLQRIRFSTNILYIRPFPGLNYSLYDFRSVKPDAVLHGVYHSATASSFASERYSSSIIGFASYCREHGVPLYVAPAKKEGSALYRSADEFMRAGILGLPRIGMEAALVKLMLAYGGYDTAEERAAFLGRNIFYEHHEGGSW